MYQWSFRTEKICKFTNQKIKIKAKNWRLNQQEWGWNWQQSGWHQKSLSSDNLMDVHPRNGAPGLPWHTLVSRPSTSNHRQPGLRHIVTHSCSWIPCHSPTAPDPPGVTRHRFHAGQKMIQEIHPVHTCTYYILQEWPTHTEEHKSWQLALIILTTRTTSNLQNAPKYWGQNGGQNDAPLPQHSAPSHFLVNGSYPLSLKKKKGESQ